MYTAEIGSCDTTGPQFMPSSGPLLHSTPCIQLIRRIHLPRFPFHILGGQRSPQSQQRILLQFITPAKEATRATAITGAISHRVSFFFTFLKNDPLVATYKECTVDIGRVSSHHGALQCGLPMQAHRRFRATILHWNGRDDHIRRNVHHHLRHLGSLWWHVRKREMLLLRNLSNVARRRHHDPKEAQSWILPHDAGRAPIKHGQETSSNRGVRQGSNRHRHRTLFSTTNGAP